MRGGEAAVRFLQGQLPSKKTEPAPFKKWILDLDSAEFRRREKAEKELADDLTSARPFLEEALGDNPSLETRQRIKRLLDKLVIQPPSPGKLRELRALEVLEHIGTKVAEEVLRGIAEGNYDPELAAAAKAARKRLSAKSPRT
jgi:hypothetical protein